MEASYPTIHKAANSALPGLVASLMMHADHQPHAPLLCQAGLTVTYQSFAEQVKTLSTSLFDIGVRRSDRVILHLGNCTEAAVACFASMMLGAIAVPINVHYKSHELSRLVLRLRPAIYFGKVAQRNMMNEVPGELLREERRIYLDGTPKAQHSEHGDQPEETWQTLMETGRETRAFAESDPNATAILLCTSGTTGEPKLVAHTHGSIARAIEYMKNAGFNRSVRSLLPNPLFHMSGVVRLFATVSAGASIALPKSIGFDAAAFLDAIEEHRCTEITVTPFGAAEMIREQAARRRETGSLRTCIVAGDASSTGLQARFEETFRRPLLDRFGMTEAPSCVIAGRNMHTMRARPYIARLVDRNGKDVPVGTPGELHLRDDALFQGYWIAPGVIDTARDADGWFRTGDLVLQDEHGDLTYVSRLKEIIVRDGENIAPAEIEQTLLSHAAVVDAAVIGVKDEKLGERIVGFVKLAGRLAAETTLQAINAWLATKLADHKLPEVILKIEQVPRTAAGKVDRHALRNLANSELGVRDERRT